MTPARALFDVASDRLSALDAAFLYLERPTEPLHVGALMMLEGPVPYDRLVVLLGERLEPLRRYRQRPVRPPFDLALPRWIDDAEFDVRRHVRRVELPAPGGEAELHAVVDRLFAMPVASGAPLWETYLIDGVEGGRSAILTKVHHCMIDGVSGAKVLEVMTDASPDVATSVDVERLAANANGGMHTALAGVAASFRCAVDAVVHPSALVDSARGVARAAGAVAATLGAPLAPTALNGTVGVDRRIVWASFSLDDFLALRGAAGCKVNDVVLAVITGALRRHFLARGLAPPADGVRTLVPVNVRRAEDALALGNRVSALFATLPVDVSDPIERLRRIATETRALKAAGQSRALELALALAGTVPAPSGPLLARLSALKPLVHTVCTNVPGPREPRWVLGRRVVEMHPIVPIALGMGVGFAILSYDGRVSIAANSDPALVPGAERLPEMLHDAAAELHERIAVAARAATSAASPAAKPKPSRAATPAPSRAAAPPTRLGDLMTVDPITIAPHDTLANAWTLMRERRIRHLPVVERDGRLVGLVTHRDLLAASQSSLTIARESERVRFLGAIGAFEIMETHLSTGRTHEPASAAGARMIRHKIGCLPVVGDDGRLVGMVTEEDFLRWATAHMTASAA